MPTAEIAPARSVYYERRGSGAPLLLIQGMAGHHKLWGEPLLAALAPHFTVVTYDHRGVGESTDTAGDFTIAELAQDAAALLDVLAIGSAHVMGISMGGMVAQELVLRRPELVQTLTLGCTFAGGPGSTLEAPGPTRMLAAMSTGNLDAALRAAYDANLSPGFAADEAHYEPFRSASLAVRVSVPTVMRQAQAAFGHDTSRRLPGVAAPTLVLHGTADQMLSYSNGVHIAALIPGARLRTLTDVGHLFWWEQPDVAAALLIEHAGA